MTDLKNWRPTSFNVDYKLLSKVLAKRMEQLLPKLIHPDQTGFISGTYIGHHISLLSKTMEFSDVKEAFNFIVKPLEAFKFGHNFKTWVSALSNIVRSLAVMNGSEWWTYQ